MAEKIRCPNCDQDYLDRVELVPLKRDAILCPECEAMWFRQEDVGPPTEGSYGVTWFRYSALMDKLELPRGNYGAEIKIVGPLTR